MPKKKSDSKFGLIALLIKLGPKLLGVLAKFGKFFKGGKFLMAGASFGAWALFFDWRFVIILMGSILIHELGHIRAMKAYGMKTKGIYFIPMLGAAAVTDEMFPSRKAESMIALWGPIWGLILALVVFDVYLWTGNPVAAAIAAWMAMVNLFNLLPINPLDGGRVIKSIAFSLSGPTGVLMMVAGFVLAFFLALKLGLALIWFLLIIGLLEALVEFKRVHAKRYQRDLINYLAEFLRVEPFAEAIETEMTRIFHEIAKRGQDGIPKHILSEHKDLFAQANPYDILITFNNLVLAECHEEISNHEYVDTFRPKYRFSKSAWTDAVLELHFGLMHKKHKHTDIDISTEARLSSLDSHALFALLKKKDPQPPMKTWETALSALVFVALAAAFLTIMYTCSIDPASSAALELFTS